NCSALVCNGMSLRDWLLPPKADNPNSLNLVTLRISSLRRRPNRLRSAILNLIIKRFLNNRIVLSEFKLDTQEILRSYDAQVATFAFLSSADRTRVKKMHHIRLDR